MDNSDDRRSPRVNVIMMADVEFGKARILVRISNLSAHGALVIGDGLPPCDTQVIFRCNDASIEGWVMWVGPGRAGIQFSEPVSPEAFGQKAQREQTIITRDERSLDYRRPGFRGNQLSAEERRIVEEWNRLQSDPHRSGRP